MDTPLVNTQHYKVRIKGKMEQSRKWSSAPLPLGVVAIEKGAFGSPTLLSDIYMPTSPHEQDATQGLFFNGI